MSNEKKIIEQLQASRINHLSKTIQTVRNTVGCKDGQTIIERIAQLEQDRQRAVELLKASITNMEKYISNHDLIDEINEYLNNQK